MSIFRTCLRAAPIVFLMSSGASIAASAYSQPGSNLACSPSCWASFYDTNSELGTRTFDDFTLTTAADITSVQWRGFAQAGDPALNPIDPITTTWNISFWSDTGGGPFSFPDSVLYSVDVAAADVDMTLVALSPFFNMTVSLYDFTVTLPSAFSALAGEKYWFAPMSIQNGMDPLFQWSAAAVNVDGWSRQQSLVGTFVSQPYLAPNDRAFSLDAGVFAPVPEPATWIFIVGGFGIVGAAARRQRSMVRRCTAC